jgi:hypothetical protein
MNIFAASGVYVEMSPWPPPFTMMERQGYVAAFKITLSREWLKCKNGRMMRTFLSWIQPHLYGAILRHLLNMSNSFLYSSTNYFDNRLLPNDLIIVRNDEDDDEGEREIKRVLQRQEDAHIMVRIQSNSEFQVSLRVQLRVHDHIGFILMYRMHTKSDLDVLHMHETRLR